MARTPAAKLDGHLPDAEKVARRDELMRAQQPIAHAHARGQIGRTLDVIVDRRSDERPDVWIARTKGDAPDIDQTVWIRGGADAGAIVRVRIDGSSAYDLIGCSMDQKGEHA